MRCRARDWVAEELDLEHDAKLSLFETVIRAVGGLMSAYDATHDALFLARAEALAAKCMPNFLGAGPQHHCLHVVSCASVTSEAGARCGLSAACLALAGRALHAHMRAHTRVKQRILWSAVPGQHLKRMLLSPAPIAFDMLEAPV